MLKVVANRARKQELEIGEVAADHRNVLNDGRTQYRSDLSLVCFQNRRSGVHGNLLSHSANLELCVHIDRRSHSDRDVLLNEGLKSLFGKSRRVSSWKQMRRHIIARRVG